MKTFTKPLRVGAQLSRFLYGLVVEGDTPANPIGDAVVPVTASHDRDPLVDLFMPSAQRVSGYTGVRADLSALMANDSTLF